MGRRGDRSSHLTRRTLLRYSAYGGLAACLIGSSWINGCSEKSARRNPPNIVLILIDTLRPDHLASYGYGIDTAPTIRRLAR